MTDHTNDATPDAAGPRELDCHAVVRRLWDYLDGRLGPADVRDIDAHLASCVHCPPHFAFERAFLAAVAEARAADGEDVARLRERVVTALRRDGYSMR